MNKPTVENVAKCETLQPRLQLRLGVVLDSYQAPGWIHDLLDQLSCTEAIDLCLLVVDESAKAGTQTKGVPLLFRLWSARDQWLRRYATGALQMRDCSPLFSGKRWHPAVLPIALGSVTPASDAMASIHAANLDLLLHLGQGELPPEAVDWAALGVWMVQEGNSREEAASVGLLRDMHDGNVVFTRGPQVVELTRKGSRTLYRAIGITSFLSLALNRNLAYRNIAGFLTRKLSDVPRVRAEAGESPVAPEVLPLPEMRPLGNLRVMGFLLQWAGRIVRHEIRKRLFREQWLLVLRPASETTQFTVQGNFYIQPPSDRFYADPFLIERNGRTYLFFEDYRYDIGKGLISFCEIGDAGNYGPAKVALECDYHLSYPFLFEWQGEIYMIPETRDNHTIEMYRAENFPDSWVRETVLMQDVSAADTTLLQYQGRWWLFAAGVQYKCSPDHELFLYYADSPLGPWTPHPKNPIVSDPRRARPAGKLYVKDGKLIRPGQDSATSYGRAIQLHQVDVLSETDYQETPLTRITSNWIPGGLGTHTFNQSSKFQVIDARVLISRFPFLPLASRRPAVPVHVTARMEAAVPNPRQAADESAKLYAGEAGENSK